VAPAEGGLTMPGPTQLDWRETELFYGRKKVARIVQDTKYPSMWRVVRPDGTLSDMVNRTRAADAAMGMALALLNNRTKPSARRRPATAI